MSEADRDRMTGGDSGSSGSPGRGQRGVGRRIVTALGTVAMALVVVALLAWGTLFLRYSNIPNDTARLVLAAVFGVGSIVAFLVLKRRRRTLLVFLAACAVLITWFLSIPPSNDREWSEEVAVLPTASVNGDLVEIRNIRNFEYRTETDFTPRYYDKTFDLRKLECADLICVYWGSPAIAHVIASFGFGGSDFVAFSIEMRKEKGEEGSMLKSFFRHYELTYIVADERDVLRLRTNFRNPREQVHVYRSRLPLEYQRKVFLSYVDKINELSREPEWYNTIDDNCTTGVLTHTHGYKARAHYSWKVLLSGYAAEFAYGLGLLDTSMPFEELQQRCLVNAVAERCGDAEDFSVRIREGLPSPQAYSVEEFLSNR